MQKQASYVTDQDLQDALQLLGVAEGVDNPRGFDAPNYTQVPNDLFESLMCDMGEAELKVVLCVCRMTFGYHRVRATLGIGDIRKMSGLSYQGVVNGAKAAEARGLIRRVNPDEITKAEWEIIETPQRSRGVSAKPLNVVEDTPQRSRGVNAKPLNVVEGTPQRSRGQVGLNKDKEINKESDSAVFAFYQNNFELLTAYNSAKLGEMIDEFTSEWVLDALKLSVDQGKKSLAYAGGILKRWRREGKREIQPAAQVETFRGTYQEVDESQFVPNPYAGGRRP